ncbi:MAG TPA: SDR family oxidoreductase [Bacillales bacterium]
MTRQVVMITGASRGLGKAVAKAFARQGADLAICSRGNEELLAAKTELEKLGANVLAVQADISISRDIERFAAEAETRYGKIDVLINNASALGPSPMPYLLDYPKKDFQNVFRVNTEGPFLLTRRIVPGMLQRRSGAVINVTSDAGQTGFSNWGAYSGSKFALEGLSQVWANELDGTGVTVNMVDPGEMDTEMHALAFPDYDEELALPDEATEAFLFLASEEARHVNGQRIEAQKFSAEEAKNQWQPLL